MASNTASNTVRCGKRTFQHRCSRLEGVGVIGRTAVGIHSECLKPDALAVKHTRICVLTVLRRPEHCSLALSFFSLQKPC